MSSHPLPLGKRAWAVSELCLWGQSRQLGLREGLGGGGWGGCFKSSSSLYSIFLYDS